MKSGDNEKKPKVGPREQQLRDMREARVTKNKTLIDKAVRTTGDAIRSKAKAKVKNVAGKIKERVKAKVVQFKAKRGRSGR